MITNDQYLFLRKHSAFRLLTVEQFDYLAKFIVYREIPKNQILFFEGDTRDKFYFIKKGFIKIEQYDDADNFSYVDFIKQEDLFPYGGIFKDDNYHYTATTITSCDVFYIPVEPFEKVCLQNTAQLMMLCQKMGDILQFHEFKLRNMVASSAVDRIIRLLSVLYVDLLKGESDSIPFPITTIELATLSGTTRETVSRVMKTLKKDDVIGYDNKIITFKNKAYFEERSR